MSRFGADRLAVASGLSTGYGGAPVLEDVSFAAERGETIGVLGPNGGGKSTLFRVMLGDLAPSSGTLRVKGRCGLVPQTERSRLDYPVSALDVALMGTLSRLPWWRPPGRSDRRRALEALAAVGLGDIAGRRFGALSGGQRQRVLIARALVQDAELVLLDEPFSGVDEPSAAAIMALIDRLASEGRGVMIATHDLDQVRRWDRVLCLNRRQIAFGNPEQTLTRPVLEATYGGALTMVGGDGEAPAAALLPPHHHTDGEAH
jgi:ABC-type Mn2+/Zn2+ transport system ATPase subunit